MDSPEAIKGPFRNSALNIIFEQIGLMQRKEGTLSYDGVQFHLVGGGMDAPVVRVGYTLKKGNSSLDQGHHYSEIFWTDLLRVAHVIQWIALHYEKQDAVRIDNGGKGDFFIIVTELPEAGVERILQRVEEVLHLVTVNL